MRDTIIKYLHDNIKARREEMEKKHDKLVQVKTLTEYLSLLEAYLVEQANEYEQTTIHGEKLLSNVLHIWLVKQVEKHRRTKSNITENSYMASELDGRIAALQVTLKKLEELRWDIRGA